ncbi:MAG: hypothetical protein H7070_01295, partial [Saprospiraceae bacterium]|nr:hypothetical protein [Pyrinomonadaceae bacterium]
SSCMTLTIVIYYTLNFADRRTKATRDDITDWNGKIHYAIDSNGDWFEIDDWTFETQKAFNRKLLSGVDFWDRAFMLRTPDNYDGFDFKVPPGEKGATYRPDVLCRFVMVGGVTSPYGSSSTDIDAHLTFDVVRPKKEWAEMAGFQNGRKTFRSNSELLIEDETIRTIWHELGHNLDQDHIQALLGNGSCSTNTKLDSRNECYATPAGMEANVMGNGVGLILANAQPWTDAIAEHTSTSPFAWGVSKKIMTPARKIADAPQPKPVLPGFPGSKEEKPEPETDKISEKE